MTEKENINEILEDIRKKLKPSGGPLTSIDPKKMEKVSEDLEIAKEIAKGIGKDKHRGDDDNEDKGAPE